MPCILVPLKQGCFRRSTSTTPKKAQDVNSSAVPWPMQVLFSREGCHHPLGAPGSFPGGNLPPGRIWPYKKVHEVFFSGFARQVLQ